VKLAKEVLATEEKHAVYMYWMQARDIPKYETPFQKVCFCPEVAVEEG